MKSAEPGSALARARIRAHQVFDPLWQSGKMKRGPAYAWLAQQMGLTREQCHMVDMTEEQCDEVVRICGVLQFEDLTQ